MGKIYIYKTKKEKCEKSVKQLLMIEKQNKSTLEKDGCDLWPLAVN